MTKGQRRAQPVHAVLLVSLTASLIGLWLICGILSAALSRSRRRSGAGWSFLQLLTSMLDVTLLIGGVALLAGLLSGLGGHDRVHAVVERRQAPAAQAAPMLHKVGDRAETAAVRARAGCTVRARPCGDLRAASSRWER